MKLKTTFQIKNSNIAPMDNKEKLSKFGMEMGIKNPVIEEIQVRVLETGDIVTIAQPYGGRQDEDGITHGSKLRQISGTYRGDNELIGSIYAADGTHIQAISPTVEDNSYTPILVVNSEQIK